MKAKLICISLIFAVSNTVNAQDPPKTEGKFKPFYFAFGLDFPQGRLHEFALLTLTPEQNITEGYWGLKNGFNFETGWKFYFNKTNDRFRIGLDWTILSASVAQMDWIIYSVYNNGSTGTNLVNSFSTRFGPVISYKIVKKLIADFRFQLAPTYQACRFSYYSPQPGDITEVIEFQQDEFKESSGMRILAGTGIRWGFIGLAVDYVGGKVKQKYRIDNYSQTQVNFINFYTRKFPSHYLQLKVSFNF